MGTGLNAASPPGVVGASPGERREAMNPRRAPLACPANRPLIAACVALFVLGQSAAASADGPTTGATPRSTADATKAKATQAMNAAELEALLAPLADDAPAARRDAAKAVGALDEGALPAITQKLAELRKLGTSAAIGAAVKEATKAREGDLCARLVELPRELPRVDAASLETATKTAALVRALAAMKSTPATRQLVKIAGDHGGAFRPELARLVREAGDAALPALIETRRDGSSEVRHWAYGQLEAMGKRIPGDAVQTTDYAVLVEVLRAYGHIRDLDAAPVLLSFVNADRDAVRDTARTAVRAIGQDALWKLREAYQNLAGKAAPEGATAAEVATELFATYDKLRLQEVYGLLEDGLARERESATAKDAVERERKLDAAIAAFDKVLARQPELDRRAEMVPAYVAHAARLVGRMTTSDRGAARTALQKALRLAPDGPRAKSIQAELAYLEARDLGARGIEDRMSFEHVLTLDPTHAGARAELTRIDAIREDRQQQTTLIAAAGASLLALVLGLVLFVGRGRRSSPTARA